MPNFDADGQWATPEQKVARLVEHHNVDEGEAAAWAHGTTATVPEIMRWRKRWWFIGDALEIAAVHEAPEFGAWMDVPMEPDLTAEAFRAGLSLEEATEWAELQEELGLGKTAVQNAICNGTTPGNLRKTP